jgi:hypothetical protein
MNIFSEDKITLHLFREVFLNDGDINIKNNTCFSLIIVSAGGRLGTTCGLVMAGTVN